MSFIDSYKRLEKLCSEIYNDNHGVSSYIDEMINTPIGARYVPGWDEDLKQLKHYRCMFVTPRSALRMHQKALHTVYALLSEKRAQQIK